MERKKKKEKKIYKYVGGGVSFVSRNSQTRILQIEASSWRTKKVIKRGQHQIKEVEPLLKGLISVQSKTDLAPIDPTPLQNLCMMHICSQNSLLSIYMTSPKEP